MITFNLKLVFLIPTKSLTGRSIIRPYPFFVCSCKPFLYNICIENISFITSFHDTILILGYFRQFEAKRNKNDKSIHPLRNFKDRPRTIDRRNGRLIKRHGTFFPPANSPSVVFSRYSTCACRLFSLSRPNVTFARDENKCYCRNNARDISTPLDAGELLF